MNHQKPATLLSSMWQLAKRIVMMDMLTLTTTTQCLPIDLVMRKRRK